MSQKEEHKIYHGKKFDIVLHPVKGRSGAVVHRPIIRHPGAVVLIAETPLGELILIRNYRFAVNEWLVEVPAGTIEGDEAPERAAERELEEETGYCSSNLILLETYYSAPSFCDEVMYVFGALDLTLGVFNPGDDEQIEVMVCSPDRVKTLLDEGRIRDSKTLLALNFWERWKQERKEG